jgi:GTP cyclohydrolase-4
VATAYLGLGSNLGDRQANLAEAIQHLRSAVNVTALSQVYETQPIGLIDQPSFLNLACRITTDMQPGELLRFIKGIEFELGRVETYPMGPRPIDIDILFYDAQVFSLDEPPLVIPHPHLHERSFVLVPLADIAPSHVHPMLGLSVEQMLAAVGLEGVRRVEARLLPTGRDIQAEPPEVGLALTRVGISGLKRIIYLETHRRTQAFHAEVDLVVDLRSRQKGVHMSRFNDTLEEVLTELPSSHTLIERLAERVAVSLLERQGAVRSEVHIRAVFPRTRSAPTSGKTTQDVCTLIGLGAASIGASVCLVGVEADGMTACPCAQDMVRSHSRQRLLQAGLSEIDADTALAVVPIATHSQRGRGRLILSAHEDVSADDLLRIVEASMSSETYDLLKRPDEFFVVSKAHRHPKFVEDVVRDMLANLIKAYARLPGDAFAWARYMSQESIHKHDAFAERSGSLSELRDELLGERPAGRSTRLEQWIDQQLEQVR